MTTSREVEKRKGGGGGGGKLQLGGLGFWSETRTQCYKLLAVP